MPPAPPSPPAPRPAGTRRRRARLAAWTLGAAAILAAGAGLSVGIAWWQEWRYQRLGGAARTTLGTFNSRYSPAHTATWGDAWPTIPTTLIDACNMVRVEPERRAHFSSWLANAEPPGWLALPTDDALFRQTIASGWPRRCMRRVLHKDAVTELTLSAGPSLTLPTGVYLPGMAANTAFFAAGFTLLVVAPIAALRRLRTLHRRRRLRCVGCGYPMGYGPLDAACRVRPGRRRPRPVVPSRKGGGVARTSCPHLVRLCEQGGALRVHGQDPTLLRAARWGHPASMSRFQISYPSCGPRTRVSLPLPGAAPHSAQHLPGETG